MNIQKPQLNNKGTKGQSCRAGLALKRCTQMERIVSAPNRLSNVLNAKRAEYGAELLPTVSAKWVSEFGEGFRPRNFSRMVALAEAFPTGGTL